MEMKHIVGIKYKNNYCRSLLVFVFVISLKARANQLEFFFREVLLKSDGKVKE